MELWRILAHNHWFTIRLFDLILRLCARCSGYLSGLAFLVFSRSFQSYNFLNNHHFSKIAIIIMPLPLIFDWVTQKWSLRKSNNQIRILTGILTGYAVGAFSYLDIPRQIMRNFFIFFTITVIVIGVVGARISYKPVS